MTIQNVCCATSDSYDNAKKQDWSRFNSVLFRQNNINNSRWKNRQRRKDKQVMLSSAIKNNAKINK